MTAQDLISFIDWRLQKPGWCAGLAVSLGFKPGDPRGEWFPDNGEDYFRLLDANTRRRIRDFATDFSARNGLSVQEFYYLEFRLAMLTCAMFGIDPRPGHKNFPNWFIPTARKDTQA